MKIAPWDVLKAPHALEDESSRKFSRQLCALKIAPWGVFKALHALENAYDIAPFKP